MSDTHKTGCGIWSAGVREHCTCGIYKRQEADAYTRGWNDALAMAEKICLGHAMNLPTDDSCWGARHCFTDIRALTPKPSGESGS